MRLAFLSIVLGIGLSQFNEMLFLEDAGRITLLSFVCFLLRKHTFLIPRPLSWIGIVLIGFLMGFGYAQYRLAHRLFIQETVLHAIKSYQSIEIEGVILKPPEKKETSYTYLIESKTMRCTILVNVPIIHAPFSLGETQRFRIKLKPSPAFLFREGILFTGQGIPVSPQAQPAHFIPCLSCHIEEYRTVLKTRLEQRLAQIEQWPYRGVLVALVMGEQRAIPQIQWDFFNQTGINHLVSISGLHITMLAGLFSTMSLVLIRFCWPTLFLRCPARRIAIILGGLSALLYALLAGWSVPTQRTVWMLGLAGWGLWQRKHFSGLTVWLYSLFWILFFDPWAVHAMGFWLSFSAVGILIAVTSYRLGRSSVWKEAVYTQYAVTVFSIPLLVLFFSQISLILPLANAFAIPIMSFGVTPLALAGTFLNVPVLMEGAHTLLAWLFWGLSYLTRWKGALYAVSMPSVFAVCFAILGSVVLLLPKGFPLRWCGLFLFCPLLGSVPTRPELGEWQLRLLDVGQGLSAVISTQKHVLIFDTGTPYGQLGQRVIARDLIKTGWKQLDGLIVSHDDNDHSGGTEGLLSRFQPVSVWGSVPESRWTTWGLAKTTHPLPCLRGLKWQWDGVFFEFLHPDLSDQEALSDNNQSCVLKVRSDRGQSVLLTGDLEEEGEKRLLARVSKDQIQATVLVAAHHGAKKASSPRWLESVQPDKALISVGARNRFKHPHPDTLKRFEALKIPVWRTDQHGTLTLKTQGTALQILPEKQP